MRVLIALALLATGCVAYSPKPNEANPAPFEFRLGAGDRIGISVWKEDLGLETEIGPDGAISFPLIGRIELSGLTLDEARVQLASRLMTHIKSPTVTVTLKEMRSKVIHVMGEVSRPGSVPFVRGANVVSAIQAAGSYIPATANMSEVRVIRDRVTTPRVFRVDLEKISAAEDTDMYLEPGDLVYVPPRGITSWNRVIRQFFGGDPSERFRQ
ncbi:MAG: polysaccharide biosynthesis/export family protein [Planctomycetota bacterium]